MSNDIIDTILMENTVHGRGLMAEHTLALYVQSGSNSLLFDTGQSALLAQNARILGVDSTPLHAVALSHGHYDYTGGLRAVWEQAPTGSARRLPAI
jgi:7,8-dihydropterin-6-yl-methyl-4-(beta-D-ribofuranosyl)aminobenzene 5'-phosphate synthase